MNININQWHRDFKRQGMFFKMFFLGINMFFLGVTAFIACMFMITIFIAYRTNDCNATCSRQQQICASAPIGGEYVCADPGARSVSFK